MGWIRSLGPSCPARGTPAVFFCTVNSGRARLRSGAAGRQILAFYAQYIERIECDHSRRNAGPEWSSSATLAPASGGSTSRFRKGLTYGQHWLNVKFEKSLVRVPFRVLTKEEEKLMDKNYKSISKQVKDAFKPKKS